MYAAPRCVCVCHSFAIIIGIARGSWGVYSGRCDSSNPHLAQWGLYHDYAPNGILLATSTANQVYISALIQDNVQCTPACTHTTCTVYYNMHSHVYGEHLSLSHRYSVHGRARVQ